MQGSYGVILRCSKAHRSANADAHRADSDGAGGDADAGEPKVQGRHRVLKQVGVGGEEGWWRDGHGLLHHLPEHARLAGLSERTPGLAGLYKLVTVVQTESVRLYVIPIHPQGREGKVCLLLGAYTGKTYQLQYAADTFGWLACKRAAEVGLPNAKHGLTSSTKPVMSPFWSFSRVLACAAAVFIISTAQ